MHLQDRRQANSGQTNAMGAHHQDPSEARASVGESAGRAPATEPRAVSDSGSGHLHGAYAFGEWILDLNRGALLRNRRDVKLRPKSFAVLTYLVARHGNLVSKDELFAAVWHEAFVTDGSLTQCIIEIRRALGDEARTTLRTISRRGFLFDAPVTVLPPLETTTDADAESASERAAGPTPIGAWPSAKTSTALIAAVLVAVSLGVDRGRAGEGSKRRDDGAMTTESLEAYRLYTEGRTALAHARWDDARDLLQRAIALDPAFAAAYYSLTFTRERVGEAGVNRLYQRKVAELAERLPERLRMLVQATELASSGDTGAAIALLEHLLAQYPDQEAAYTRLHNLYQRTGRPQKALEVARRGVEALPLDPDARNTLGYALLAAERYEEAVAQFDLYAELTPREANPHDSAGEAYLAMGEPAKALERFRRSLVIDPTFGSRENVSWTLAMLGRFDEAIAEIRQAESSLAARAVPIARTVRTEAFLLSRIGRYREARARLDAFLASAGSSVRPPDLVSLHLLAAILSLERDAVASAEADVTAAEDLLGRVAADDRDWIVRDGGVLVNFVAGLVQVRRGRMAAARERLSRLARLYRHDEPAQNWWYHTLAGEIALAAGAIDEAEAAFRDGEPQRLIDYSWGFERGPFLHAFRDGLARTLERRGDLPGAIAAYRRLLTPGHANRWQAVLAPRVILSLGHALRKCGDARRSHAEIERFLTLWQQADPDLPELTEGRRLAQESGRPRDDASSHCGG